MQSLDAEEQAILESVENGEWQPVPNMQEEIQRYQQYVQAQLGPLEEFRVQLSAQDVRSLQALAQQTGTSVSLLVSSVIHQYVTRQSSSQP
jgi:predicted DNA binding CopG/RHH family protein